MGDREHANTVPHGDGQGHDEQGHALPVTAGSVVQMMQMRSRLTRLTEGACMRTILAKLSVVIVVAGLVPARASAEVVRIEVQSRSDLVAGRSFGAAGPYEKIAVKIFFAADPSLPANRIVADIDKAPRNA